MPLQETSGAASYDAFGGGVPAVPAYIEEVFSTSLYTGDGSNQTITNDIDLQTNGGMVWSKIRSGSANHYLFDTARGGNYWMYSNSTDPNQAKSNTFNAVAYDGTSKYIAATTAGLLSSTDGTTWTAVTGSTSGLTWNNVQYKGGRFMAVSSARKQVARSTDGVTWTIATISTAYNFNNDVVYANGRYLLGVFNTTVTLVSADNGATWTQGDTSGGSSGNYYYIGGVGSYFVSGGGNYFNTLAYSSDGITWSQSPNQFGSGATAMYSFPELPNIIWMSNGYARLIYSTNGVNWSVAFEPGGLFFGYYTYAQNASLYYFYQVGFAGGSTTAYTSSNGISFTTVGIPSGFSDSYPLGSDGTRILIGSAGGTTYRYSTTGASNAWSSNQTAPISPVDSFLYAGSRVFIPGNLQYASSSNATSWSTGTLAGGAAIVFNTNGFQLNGTSNISTYTYASWTFRKQPKFFDVVTYTGNGVSGRTIAHNLGSVPGCIIVKATSNSAEGLVYHRSLGNTKYLTLFSTSTAAADTWSSAWNDTSPTSTNFTVGNGSNSNANGWTFVAYLFAHDAGGFGAGGTDNVISCGSYTGNGSSNGPEVNLGYEPQFVMIRAAENVRTSPTSYNNWAMVDVMRGMPNPSSGTGYALGANTSEAENGGYLAAGSTVYPTATGFKIGTSESMYNYNGCTYIYIAIRRGPMKVPTDGTKVFNTTLYTGNASSRTVTFSSAMPYTDMGIWRARTGSTNEFNDGWWTTDRLRGMTSLVSGGGETTKGLLTAYTNAEAGGAPYTVVNNTYELTSGTSLNVSSATFLNYMFRRAPSFMDVVCYTGNGSTQNISHNLGVVPELMIVKVRSVSGDDWVVYCSKLTDANIVNLRLNKTQAVDYNGDMWDATTPTATAFRVGSSVLSNYNGQTLVAYLFATCPGVSKVGSYTGTGALQTVNCGFTSAARFVLIKRTDSTGGWFVYDSARGLQSGNDPYMLLNSTAAEVTGTDYVEDTSVGFKVNASGSSTVNVSGGTYIFLAIA